MIVKHANPCGVALAGGIEDAYVRAVAADPVSAYGGVVVLNRPVTAELAERLAEQFVEVLFAPGFENGTLRRPEAEGGDADPRLDRAGAARTPTGGTTAASSAASSPRTATPTSRTARR